jgi:hypothetical protein
MMRVGGGEEVGGGESGKQAMVVVRSVDGVDISCLGVEARFMM